MRNRIGFSCLLILVLFCFGSAMAAQVPLPRDFNIVPPSADLPKEIGAFSGRWEGTWDGLMETILIVEEIGPEKAKIIYAWADAPAWNVKQGYKRYIAEVISGGKTTLNFIADNKAKFVVELGADFETIKMVRSMDATDQPNLLRRKNFAPEREYSREIKMKKVK